MYWSCLFNGINGISAIFCTINDIKLSIDHNPDTSDTYFIFIHGLQSRKEIFSHIIKKLNEKYSIPYLTLDLVGFGNSEKKNSFSYDLFDQVKIVESLMDYLKIKK